MAVNKSAAEPVAPRYDFLELLVKVAALVAVVLPIVGVGVRAIAFTLAGVHDPIEMAVAQPVSDLVSTALKAVAPVAGGIVLLAPTVYQDWPRPNVAPRSYHRLPTPLALVIGAVFLAAAATLLPWPGGFVGVFGVGAVSFILGFWAARRQLSFYRVAAAVFLAAIASAVGAGINGVAVGDHVNTYRFAASAALTDGTYALVGDSDGFLYLESCQRSGIIGVNQQEIVEFNAVKASSPWPSDSLYGIIFGGGTPRVGYRPEC
ncbi:MAG TPA: hypothetical protein DEV93_10170 [Chloroflexi bacterium]|nr:hypothetical protein [Chloroflexota bacterium]